MAIANVRIDSYSYFKTLQNAYAISEQVLCRGLLQAFEGKSIATQPNGKVYSLPDNLEVLAFAWELSLRKAVRLLYGALFFKSWNISTLNIGTDLETFLSEGDKTVHRLGFGLVAFSFILGRCTRCSIECKNEDDKKEIKIICRSLASAFDKVVP